MLFTSTLYLVFLPCVLFFYYRLRPEARRHMLLVTSWLFYGVYNPWFIWVILATTSVDWVAANNIHNTEDPRRRKLWLVASICSNIGLLGYFKYSAFAADNLSPVAQALGLDFSSITWRWALPLGISFHTFQGISYAVDVYRREIEPIRSFTKFALFVSFFPQLVAGPIVRAPEFIPQIDFKSEADGPNFRRGIALIIYGMAKKVYVADVMATWANDAYADPTRFSGFGLFVATCAFAVQIYCDFSGYSDIAIGSAALFGIRLPDNFDRPYLATSIREFWQRWHMTLSRWLRDYLYVPLGGNRKGSFRTYVNLMLTMVIGGFWHGAGWNWAVWGAIQGAVMSIERATGFDRAPKSLVGRGLRWLITFSVVLVSWVFFRAANLDQAGLILQRMFTGQPGVVHTDMRAAAYAAAGLCLIFSSELFGLKRRWLEWCSVRPVQVRWVSYACAIVFALTFARASHQEFIYFAF